MSKTYRRLPRRSYVHGCKFARYKNMYLVRKKSVNRLDAIKKRVRNRIEPLMPYFVVSNMIYYDPLIDDEIIIKKIVKKFKLPHHDATFIVKRERASCRHLSTDYFYKFW